MALKVTLASNVEGWDIMMNDQLETALAGDNRFIVSGFVPGYTEEQREHARQLNVTLYDAKVYPGYDAAERLAYPPDDLEIDLLIMHSYGRHVGRQASIITEAKQCKWVLVVHTISEELEKYLQNPDAPSSASAQQESEHDLQVKLCEKADLVLAVGPQVAEAYKAALRYCGKKVFALMPTIPEEFIGVHQQNTSSHEVFRVLISASAKYFKVKGCDIGAKALKLLNDATFKLILIVKSNDDTAAVKQAMLKEGVTSSNQLTVRECPPSVDTDKWRQLLGEVDLLIKPSRTEGFGMSGLRAISADLPVLVSGTCGLGIALKKLNSGGKHVVDSQDPQVWAEKIKEIRAKPVQTCHSEAEQLRNEYHEEYKWEDHYNLLVEEFFKLIPQNNGGEGRDGVDGSSSTEEQLKLSIQETDQGEGDAS